MTVELHMLPIKAGDATLIIDRSVERPYTVLIDAGLAEDEIVSYVQSVGVYHFDLIILSHPDLDHLQGLLSLLKNPLVSVDQVWCFDLAFLRDFVTTGRIPQPTNPTHGIVYYWLIRTLDGMDKVLKTLSNRNVLTLQVSAGHRLALGSLYIEVLYPWDGFYRALRSPARIRELLAKKWPADWLSPEWARESIEHERPAFARKVTAYQEQGVLRRLMDRLDIPGPDADPQPLARPGDKNENEVKPGEETWNDTEEALPVSEIGTLYNNLSIVVKIHVLGGINPPTMLFPGDLSDWTYLFARRLPDLSADVFKYPHHGSAGPGISRQALRRLGFQFLGPCPCGPWCHLEYCEWFYHFWHRMEKGIARRDTFRLFAEAVRPQHTLVYPYPSQRLPRPGVFSAGMGQIHANRKNLEAKLLADPCNPATPCVLKIGKERCEIAVSSTGAKA